MFRLQRYCEAFLPTHLQSNPWTLLKKRQWIVVLQSTGAAKHEKLEITCYATTPIQQWIRFIWFHAFCFWNWKEMRRNWYHDWKRYPYAPHQYPWKINVNSTAIYNIGNHIEDLTFWNYAKCVGYCYWKRNPLTEIEFLASFIYAQIRLKKT